MIVNFLSSAPETAELLQVSPRTVQRLIHEKECLLGRVGHQWRINESQLAKWIKGRQRRPRQNPRSGNLVPIVVRNSIALIVLFLYISVYFTAIAARSLRTICGPQYRAPT